MPLSAHCAPSLQRPRLRGARDLRHLEYFHDHDRIEQMLFDGALDPTAAACGPTRRARPRARALKDSARDYEVR